MNEDGTMARRNDLKKFAKTHNLTIVSIAQLIQARLKKEILLEKTETAKLPTVFGQLHGFRKILLEKTETTKSM